MIAAAIGLAALLLGLVSINGARWRHALAYCGSVVLVFVAVAASMGQPRPAWLGHKPGIALLAMSLDEGHAIYVWTQDGEAPPVAYALPWNEQMAADAQHALQQAAATHTQARWGAAAGEASTSSEASNGSRPGTQGGQSAGGQAYASAAGFYASPQPALPLKTKP
jgi:hypothetical protein